MFSKKSITIAALIACISIAYVYINQKSSVKTVRPVVAITQIAPHPSLDEIRRGIMDVLSESNITDDQVIFQNAQGSPSTALQIAQKFVSLKPKIIAPITTPSAQAAYGVARSAGIPVIFGAVNDPISAKLFDPNEKNSLIAGVSDLPPIAEQIAFIKDFFPNGDTVGIVYNPGEANSVVVVKLFEEEAKKYNIKVIRSTVTGTNSVSTAVSHLVGKTRIIYLPNDNTVIAAFDSVLKIANKHKMAVFTSDPESVSRGALACVAHNQYAIGKKTGEMIVQYLNKEKSIEELAIQSPTQVDRVLNMKTLKDLDLDISQDLLRSINVLVKK